MLVKVDGNKGMLLLEPNPRLADLLCIEDSVLEVTQDGTAMVVVSNSSKMSNVLRRGEVIGTAHKVSVVNSLDMNVNSNLQTVSFIEVGGADEGQTNTVPVKDSGSPNTVPANLPDELILADDNEILSVGEQVEDEQFSHEKRKWRKQQLKSLYSATLNSSLSPEDTAWLLEVLTKHHGIFSLEGKRGETSLVEFAIDTGDAAPKKQRARRIPHTPEKKLIANWKRCKLKA